MTGDVDEASIQSCVDSGMDAHVGKPIDRDELVRVLGSRDLDGDVFAHEYALAPLAEMGAHMM